MIPRFRCTAVIFDYRESFKVRSFSFIIHKYRCAKLLPHGEEMRQQLHALVGHAIEHWSRIPEERRNFDQAKAEFQRRLRP